PDLDLDAVEERRAGVEDEAIGAGGGVGELADPAVVVGLAFGNQLVAAEELDAHAARRLALARVEDVRRDHVRTFLRGAAVDKKSHSRRSSSLRDWVSNVTRVGPPACGAR